MMTISTEVLIKQISAQAGGRSGPKAQAFSAILLVSTLLSFLSALAVVVLAIKVRADFGEAMTKAPFLFKLGSTVALACGGFFLVRRTMEPGRGRPVMLLLLPGGLLLLYRALTDSSGLSYLGHSDRSPLFCMMSIISASLPAFAIMLWAARKGASTRPALTGAFAGLVSGSLGAAAYAFSCDNDAGLFVLIWYSLAIALVSGIGALFGKKLLSW